jgi:hypothetical protein
MNAPTQHLFCIVISYFKLGVHAIIWCEGANAWDDTAAENKLALATISKFNTMQEMQSVLAAAT